MTKNPLDHITYREMNPVEEESPYPVLLLGCTAFFALFVVVVALRFIFTNL